MNENEKCQLCLIKKENTIEIFSEEGVNLNISQIITQHFWLELLETDDISKTICYDCWRTVENFNGFYNSIKLAHKSLYNTQSSVEEAVNEENFIKLENIKNEIVNLTQLERNPVLSSTINITTTDPAITIENNANINYNNDGPRELSSMANHFLAIYTEEEKFNYEENKNSVECASQSSHSSQHSLSLEDDSYESPVPKRKVERSRSVRAERSERYEKSTEKSTRLVRKRKLKSLESSRSGIEKGQEDEVIRKYCRMECDLCQTKFDKFLDAKSHYRQDHNRAGYILCNNNNCKKRFFRRFRILEHISTHFNPDIFRCHICKKVCADKSSLKEHLDVHVPPEDRKYRCDKCPKSYTKKYQLDTHNTSHMSDEEKKFICDVCDKPFATNLILQTHKRCVHECVTHICEICAKVFKNKGYFEKHLLEHQNIKIPKVQCQICGQWYKNDQGLRKHIRKHEESKELHICDICGKHAPNKTALRSHKKYSHVTERDFKCNICDKAFKKALVLKEHMTLHTGEVLYKCPYCPKTFNSSANMHSHKKKMHVKEWAENRKNLQP